jgi:hypothetical protein
MLFSVQNTFPKSKNPNKTVRRYINESKTILKKKFTKFVHGLIFEPTRLKKNIPIVKPKRINAEGKIIRNINIITLDPFGFSDTDTRNPATAKGQEQTHLKTKKIKIAFQKNRPYNLLKIEESERIIRSKSLLTECN